MVMFQEQATDGQTPRRKCPEQGGLSSRRTEKEPKAFQDPGEETGRSAARHRVKDLAITQAIQPRIVQQGQRLLDRIVVRAR